MSDPGVSPGEVGGIFAGVIAGFAALGKGASWLLNFRERQADSRSHKLALWHAELDAREKALDQKQEEYWSRIERDVAILKTQSSALRMAYELVAAPLRAIDPHNGALAQAEQLLHAAFPLDPTISPSIDHLLGRIDAAQAAG
jgi:hypothetical protein